MRDKSAAKASSAPAKLVVVGNSKIKGAAPIPVTRSRKSAAAPKVDAPAKRTRKPKVLSLKDNKVVAAYIDRTNVSMVIVNRCRGGSGYELTIDHEHLAAFIRKLGIECKDGTKFDLMEMVGHLHDLEDLLRRTDRYSSAFVDFLRKIAAYSDPIRLARAAEGFVQFEDIPMVMTPGLELIAGQQGGILRDIEFVTTMQGFFWKLKIEVVAPSINGPTTACIVVRLLPFKGELPIARLPVRIITETEKATLRARGERFVAYSAGSYFASLKGPITLETWMGDYDMRGDGRVMIDAKSFKQIEPQQYSNMMSRFENVSGDDDFDDDDAATGTEVRPSVSPDNLWQCYYRLPAFSMRLKRWGWASVDDVSDIVWRDDAFDNLVLDATYKKKIFQLVQHSNKMFGDFIEDKSGGLVFLLHGGSGVGKTLSAEAVAETLRRPLYSVSVGELGTDAESLETNLRRIIDLALQWNAVLLLDEADIFMEARDTDNIERNAMVSIFLRTLDYFNGVMFLTTNRVSAFDPAFYSRISLAIRYPALTSQQRAEVWKNILAASRLNIPDVDLDALAVHEVNGRNIKNVVRIAQTTGIAENRDVTQADLTDGLITAAKFTKDSAI